MNQVTRGSGRAVIGAILGAGVLLGGCGSSGGMLGTWRAGGAMSDDFAVPEATFRDDGSYSAQLVEDGREVRDSGQWSKRGRNLRLDGQTQTRTFEARLRGDELIMIEPGSGESVTLIRDTGR